MGLSARAAEAEAYIADNPPDSNIEVFQTVDEVAAARQIRRSQIWQETAAAMVQTERPDLSASPTADMFAITVEADGVRRDIDLMPIAETLFGQSARSTEILREHIGRQLPGFDQKRMARLPLDQVCARIRPMLINARRLDETSEAVTGGVPLPAKNVVADLYWLPAVRWQESGGGPATPVGPEALKAWQISLEELQRIAMENLRGEVRGELFETSTIGSAGKTGHLKRGVEAAVVLLPEFLREVRGAWNTEGDLALLLADEEQVRFTEAGNKRLLDLMWPQWQHALDGGLSARLLALTDEGVTILDYTPPQYIPAGSTRPSVAEPRGPGARPGARPYIVR
jgi:hypothetical protein